MLYQSLEPDEQIYPVPCPAPIMRHFPYQTTSHGFVVGHIVPEAQEGGLIGLIEDGDIITIDAETNTLSVDITDELLKIRKSKWVQPPYKFTRGVLHKYIKSVATASEGCVTDS